MLCALLLAAAGLLVTAPAASAGDATFETPVVTPNTFQPFSAGQQIGPWTVTRGDVHLIGAGFWQAADGVQSLDLDGGVRGGVARHFATTPLLSYRLSYALAGNPAFLPIVKTGYVAVNGQVRQQFAFDITGATYQDMNYTSKHLVFVATGFTTTIEFVSTAEPQGWGAVIDDVDVDLCLLPILC